MNSQRSHPVRIDLTRAEKFAFARRAVLGQIREIPGGLAAVLGFGSRDSALELHADPPDGSYARRAEELARDTYGPELLQHCLRCWYFADLFAQLEHRDHDPELLYVACLLHDIALTDHYRPTPADAPCFAIHGATVASRTLQTWGADTDFRDTVEEAIAAHLDVTVPPETGVEGYLLHAAARLDVVGARVRDIPPHLLRHVNTLHHRAHFASTLSSILSREARERPDSRIAVLWKAGMKLPIILNPVAASRCPGRGSTTERG
ncbi:HD domain-containing protein [Nocardia mikamii]|uniref:HD domain-containing protein n=1 Tax=Nocardia mikamii TaxID=508464 RepID=UPI0007A3747D|nr:HD domain-containing protein [Nocardia mikamii]